MSTYVKLAYIFPNLSKAITSAATPLVLTPFVHNQKRHVFVGIRRTGGSSWNRWALLARFCGCLGTSVFRPLSASLRVTCFVAIRRGGGSRWNRWALLVTFVSEFRDVGFENNWLTFNNWSWYGWGVLKIVLWNPTSWNTTSLNTHFSGQNYSRADSWRTLGPHLLKLRIMNKMKTHMKFEIKVVYWMTSTTLYMV